MSERGLIYSFVAKGTIVLAEYTAFSGNFSTIAVQCLQKLPPNSSKHTYSCDGHTFNFLVDNGFGITHLLYSDFYSISVFLLFTWCSLFVPAVFLVVAHETAGRGLPFAFLERLKDDFRRSYGARIGFQGPHPLADDDDDDDLFEDTFGIAYNLDKEFGCVKPSSVEFLYIPLNYFATCWHVLWWIRPRIKAQMEYCTNHPEEMSKISKIKAQMTEVKGIMMDNIDKVCIVLRCFSNY